MQPTDSDFLLQTCLSKGGNFYFPPCHIITVSGFRILLDCPMDLSSLTIFSPIPIHAFSTGELPSPDSVDPKRQKREKPIDSSQLIRAQPWFKTVASLHLWNVPFIDVVLISSPMGMLGLPFWTRANGFRAKVNGENSRMELFFSFILGKLKWLLLHWRIEMGFDHPFQFAQSICIKSAIFII